MSTDDRTETITDRAAIRASDEPSERGDFPYYDLGPATSETVGAPDLDALHETICDKFTGMDEVQQAADALVAEVERLRQDIDECWVPLYHDTKHERDQATARAEAAEDALARVTREAEALRAKVAAVEALAERLAASLALVLYDAHPVYGSTALWHGGIGGQAITAHCAIIHGGPPGMEWTESDLPSMALREFIAASPGFDLDAAKAAMLADIRAALATGEGK